MCADNFRTERRVVEPFRRISLTDYGVLNIEQGDRETLTVQSHPDVLTRIRTEVTGDTLHLGLASWVDRLADSLTTSLTRKAIVYHLTVAVLESLQVKAVATVTARGIRSNVLSVSLFGPVALRMNGLSLQKLVIDSSGASVEIDGQTNEQTVRLRGLGAYRAQRLRSQDAIVKAEGTCQAWVWAEHSLDYSTHGLAQVHYAGSPSVRARAHGFPVLPFAPRAPGRP